MFTFEIWFSLKFLTPRINVKKLDISEISEKKMSGNDKLMITPVQVSFHANKLNC